MNTNHSVYIVLSRSRTMLSTAIHILKGDKYTHVALSLDKGLKYMFRCRIAEQIEVLLLDSNEYSYNYLGMIGNLLGKSCRGDARFFCSGFVYHVLNQSGVCELGR